MNQYKDVIGFLEKNGFSKMETNSYANDLCNVRFMKDEGGEYYAVADNNGWAVYSPNLNIYWLIGYLTWYDFIPKNYIK